MKDRRREQTQGPVLDLGVETDERGMVFGVDYEKVLNKLLKLGLNMRQAGRVINKSEVPPLGIEDIDGVIFK